MRDEPTFPRMALVEQRFDPAEIADAARATARALRESGQLERLRPGETVAVTAGSRGIDRIDEVTAAVCQTLRDRGATPFVFPAMGSHGGATAQGQSQLLAGLGEAGITEETVGAPIRSTMDVVELGRTPEGFPVLLDAHAAAADHIVVVNRVKAHTKFKARIESGMFKMMAIGMGKHAGATQAHRLAVRRGFAAVIESVGRAMLARAPILAGVGLVENAFGRLREIRALGPREMETGEAELLARAKSVSAKLPFASIDLLIVDEIGKDISGTGMDTNVTGRNRDILGDFTVEPRVKRIFVRDLSPASGGNALGVGYADFTTDRLVKAMDYRKTVTNALTGVSPEKAAIPIHFATDREAVEAALHSLGCWEPEAVGVVRIRNTLRLGRLLVSEGLLGALPGNASVIGQPGAMVFDLEGNLADFAP